MVPVFLCCGDALFDLFVDSSPKSNDIALSGGVGGSPLNVAIGLARLGHHSHYLTKLSTDPFGARMKAHLKQNGLDIGLCIDTDQNTTLAIVEKQADGSAKYVFYIDNTADASLNSADLPIKLPEDIRFLHVASYSTILPQTGAALIELVERESKHRAISYDPNLRLMIEPNAAVWKTAFERIASHAFVVKASDEDVDTLIGPGEYDEFLQRCIDLGAQVAFLTRGADGAMGMDCTGKRVELPGVSIDVEDTVGAGDTFHAAVLHWLYAHQHVGSIENGRSRLAGELNLAGCMNFALQAASITCTRRGADLPNLKDIELALNR